MPFYAYALSSNTTYDWRYLITFPSQGVADEWWRAIQDQVAKKVPNWDHIKRITPQLYNYNPAIKWITQTVTDPTGVPQFFTRVFFTYLYAPTIASVGTVIPVQEEITDHVSGQQFYIRSTRDSTLHWFITAKDRLVATTRNDTLTRFLIQRKADPTDTRTILIDSDEILISVPSAGTSGKDNFVSTNSEGRLFLGSFAETFKFGDLKNGFKRQASIAKDADSFPVFLFVEKTNEGHGERWELA